MRSLTDRARPTAAAAPTRRRRQPPTAAIGVLLVVIAALVATGCLPSGERGAGSGAAGSGASGGPTVSASLVPGSPTPRPSIVPPTPTPEPTFLVYVVARGDNLNTIAHRFGTTARSIAFWNRATYPSLDPESARYRPDLLKIGWTLFLRPNDVVDEQDLPEPSDSTVDEPSDAAATDDPDAGPSDMPVDEPSDSPPAE